MKKAIYFAVECVSFPLLFLLFAMSELGGCALDLGRAVVNRLDAMKDWSGHA